MSLGHLVVSTVYVLALGAVAVAFGVAVSATTDATRKALQAGTPAAQIVASWRAGEAAFRLERRKYLLY